MAWVLSVGNAGVLIVGVKRESRGLNFQFLERALPFTPVG